MTTLDPRRRYPARPVTDEDSARLVDEMTDTLVILRAPMHHGDAGAELHALTSLIAEAKVRLPRVVADARDQQHSWTDIARQLQISRVRAVVRYRVRTNKRRTPLNAD